MWKNIDRGISNNDAINQVHHAAQFIGLTGKNLLEDQTDDSNTNMGWLQDKSAFAGHWIQGSQTFRLELEVLEFRLVISGLNFNTIFSLSLDGMTRDQIFNWLLSSISSLGLDSSKLRYIDHYKIQKHETMDGVPFRKPDLSDLEIIALYYSDADYLLREFNKSFDSETQVRVWPHHFDIGSYIPFNEDSAALGIGMAIPDSLINDFYFYQYGWSESREVDYSILAAFPDRGKWHDQDWRGGALPVKELYDVSNQEKTALTFFQFSKEQLLSQII